MQFELISRLFVVLAGLCGFLLAYYLFHKHQNNEPLICPLDSDCNKVIHSHYSHFFGIPLPVMGMGYYLLVAITYSLFILLGPEVNEIVWFIVMGVTIGSFLFSLYLVSIQAFVLKEWCTWCLGSAFISCAIFLANIAALDINLPAVLAEYKMIIVILHGIAAAIGLGAATVTDVFFFKFLKDYRISHEENVLLKGLSQVLWFAIGLLVLTGIGLFIPNKEALLESPKFLVKMILVFTLIFNGILLNLKISPKLILISFGKRHVHQPGEMHILRKLAFASGAFSITTWYTVFILGSLRNVTMSLEGILGIYLGVLFLAVIGSQIMDRMYTKQVL